VANHKSAVKRARQNPGRRDRNRTAKGRARASLKQARQALESGAEDAAARVRLAERELRRAASQGVIPARRASRLVSRLAKKARSS